MVNLEGPAQNLINELAGTEHPQTGREPVVVGELQVALAGGHTQKADEMAHNYATHGHIDAGLTCSPDCQAQDFPVQ